MTSRPCDYCVKPFEARRAVDRFCSARCRLDSFQRDKARKREDRDADIRRLLKTAVEAIEEARARLSPDEAGSEK